VIEAFVGPRPDWAEECRHDDGDTSNNAAGNLLWGTKKQNAEDRERHGTHRKGSDHVKSKLTEEKVKEARRRLASGETQQSVASDFGVNQATIQAVASGRTWRHVV
jgi:hypothetical protein